MEQSFDKNKQEVQGWEEGFSSCSRDLKHYRGLHGFKLLGLDLQLHSNSRE